jgi:hypothetical protein
MFEYADPVGRDFLASPAVAAAFRAKMQGVYEQFARRPQSAFTWLEAFQNLAGGQAPQTSSVVWLAFPLLAAAADTEIDRDRFRWQDEYVEWRAETANGVVTRITFTTEFPEYFEAFAQAGTAFLVDAVKDAIPGATSTVAELFGPGGDPDGLPAVARANRFRNHLRDNPWNNGQQGILCLTQQFNTLGALFNLVTECGVRQAQGSPEDTCALVGGACGPGRSSDPNICAAAQRAVRNNIAVTLRDPAGIRILRLEGVWRVNGQQIDVNDPAQNQSVWVVSRNGRRGVLTVVNGLTLDGTPITSGTQVSRTLRVVADLLAAPEAALPDWARRGNESTSRGPVS